MINPRDLYDAHREAVQRWNGDDLPYWEELPWRERDVWQAEADELNEAREPRPNVISPK